MNREPRTFDFYRDHIQAFVSAIPPGLTVANLKPYHVARVMDCRPTWGNNHMDFPTNGERSDKSVSSP